MMRFFDTLNRPWAVLYTLVLVLTVTGCLYFFVYLPNLAKGSSSLTVTEPAGAATTVEETAPTTTGPPADKE
jgi:hypothetical protein